MTMLYYDCEFSGLHRNTTLISIGIVSDTGKTFYAETSDFDRTQIDEWLQENVLDNCMFIDKVDIEDHNEQTHKYYTQYDNTYAYSTKNRLKIILEEWLQQFKCQRDYNNDDNCDIHPEKFGGCPKITMMSDCYAYDWMLFNDIWGHAFNIPKYINYIPIDLSSLLWMKGIDPDINREEFVGKYNLNYKEKAQKLNIPEQKHSALWDTFIIKQCWNILNQLN